MTLVNENGGVGSWLGVSLELKLGKWNSKWCIYMNPRTDCFVFHALFLFICLFVQKVVDLRLTVLHLRSFGKKTAL